MRVRSIELTRSRIPFRQAFSHAAASRAESDVIHVAITDALGNTGFGEIQARPYVTGETNDAVWAHTAGVLASALIGVDLADREALDAWLSTHAKRDAQPACVGGFDLALHDLLELNGALDWVDALGPSRTRPTGKCMTIGDDQNDKVLVRQARFARLSGTTVVKLKVSGPDDVSRCQTLREHLGGDIAIRLDGNAKMTYDGALALLASIKDLNIESLEEPFDHHDPATTDLLRALHAETGIDLVADESACSASDVIRCAEAGSFQIINARVGKCGGIAGTRAVVEAAIDAGLSLVCGTMVGESAVLLRYSGKLLHHCDALDYVEGIDQNKTLLADEVIVSDDNSAHSHFQWQSTERERYAVGTQNFS
ncbi:MAG: enolase C-terminal domain-like protein [Pseudomonadota bacterium]